MGVARRKLLQLTWLRRDLSLLALLTTLGETVQLLMVAERTLLRLMTGEHQFTLRTNRVRTAALPLDRRLIQCMVVTDVMAKDILREPTPPLCPYIKCTPRSPQSPLAIRMTDARPRLPPLPCEHAQPRL